MRFGRARGGDGHAGEAVAALAGLLDSQAAQIAEVYAPGCELMTVRTLDGWALLAGMRVH